MTADSPTRLSDMSMICPTIPYGSRSAMSDSAAAVVVVLIQTFILGKRHINRGVDD